MTHAGPPICRRKCCVALRHLSHELNQVKEEENLKNRGWGVGRVSGHSLLDTFAHLGPVYCFHGLCVQTLCCLLNLEPSRQYNKRSCKCLDGGLLDLGVPTPPDQKTTESLSCLLSLTLTFGEVERCPRAPSASF